MMLSAIILIMEMDFVSNQDDLDTLTTTVGDQKYWYVFRDDKHFGPFSVQGVQSLLETGAISSAHYVWKPGLASWQSVEQFENFRAYLIPNVDSSMSDLDFETLMRAEQFREEELLPRRVSGWVRESDISSRTPRIDLSPVAGQLKSLSSSVINFYSSLDPRKQKAILIAAVSIVVGVIALNYNFRLNAKDVRVYDRINSVKQEIVDSAISAKTAQIQVVPTINPKEFAIALSPQLVDRELNVQIVGVRGSLVGSPNFQARLRIEPARQVLAYSQQSLAVNSLPDGKYYISWSCNDCGPEMISGESKVASLISVDTSVYRQRLQNYMGPFKAQAQLEKDELSQLHQALQQHFDFTIGEFARINRSKRQEKVTLWERHDTQWKKDQAEMNRIFASLSDSEFLNQLVFRDTYIVIGKVSEDIGRLQYIHRQILEREAVKDLSKASLLGERLQKSLNEIKMQISNLNETKAGEASPNVSI